MSYYHAKRSQIAKQYLNGRDAEERATAKTDTRLETSRVWLGEYMARERRTSFDWRPHFVISPPEETHDEQSEDKKAKLANPSPTGEERKTEAGGSATQAGVGDAKG
jgi:hypothetical protein